MRNSLSHQTPLCKIFTCYYVVPLSLETLSFLLGSFSSTGTSSRAGGTISVNTRRNAKTLSKSCSWMPRTTLTVEIPLHYTTWRQRRLLVGYFAKSNQIWPCSSNIFTFMALSHFSGGTNALVVPRGSGGTCTACPPWFRCYWVHSFLLCCIFW